MDIPQVLGQSLLKRDEESFIQNNDDPTSPPESSSCVAVTSRLLMIWCMTFSLTFATVFSFATTTFNHPDILAEVKFRYFRHLEQQQMSYISANSHPTDNTKEAEFYVMAMSYQPEFCDLHEKYHYDGCEKPNNLWRFNLTIHGLWPQYKNGKWPQFCEFGEEEDLQKVIDSIGLDTFKLYWPNVKSSSTNGYSLDFWKHEWEKHGTCSGMSQLQYFEEAIHHFIPTPPEIFNRQKETNSYSKKVHKDFLIESYGGPGNVIPICSTFSSTTSSYFKDGSSTTSSTVYYLSEIRACFGRDKETGVPSDERIECPSYMIEDEGNCYGDYIHIPSFYVDDDDKKSKDIILHKDDHNTSTQLN